jgi:hypothetical protein
MDPFTSLANTQQDANHRDGNKIIGITDTFSMVLSNA